MPKDYVQPIFLKPSEQCKPLAIDGRIPTTRAEHPTFKGESFGYNTYQEKRVAFPVIDKVTKKPTDELMRMTIDVAVRHPVYFDGTKLVTLPSVQAKSAAIVTKTMGTFKNLAAIRADQRLRRKL